ncbi:MULTISPECIES: lipoprotein LpqH [Corynebacterium]|uniref:lipoprotein LpqH n=1 Tax=Corynebacterium TaxID=1716 RepID=UPI0006691272|nr:MULTISPECIES: lipoprotein LpqH [Corynebacterium]OFK66782.1 hypothetical protein HMPREF2807_08345 [Corynebacterium sp. HMSC074A09]OFK69469.1 hypothetical protein HMPREF2806_05330 [Corynebacterium sp. HMSC076G08]
MKVAKSITSLVAAIALTTLAACSQSDSDVSEKSAVDTTQAAAGGEQTSEDTNVDSAATSESADSTDSDAESTAGSDDQAGSTGGSYEATVDGKAIEVENETILCQEAAGSMNLTVAPEGAGTASITAVLSTDENLTVKALGMVDGEGNTLAYAESSPMGSATASKEGDTYTMSGEGLLSNGSNPTTGETKPFEVKITCS